MQKTVKNPSPQKKRARRDSRGLTAQNKKDLECILGCCQHESGCVYWKKVVDAEDPARMQFELINKMIGGK